MSTSLRLLLKEEHAVLTGLNVSSFSQEEYLYHETFLQSWRIF